MTRPTRIRIPEDSLDWTMVNHCSIAHIWGMSEIARAAGDRKPSSVPSVGFKTGIDDGLKYVVRANESTMLDTGFAFFQRYLDLANAGQVLNGVGQGPNRGFIGQTADLDKQVFHGVLAAGSNQWLVRQRFFHEVRRPGLFAPQRNSSGDPGSSRSAVAEA